MCNLNAFSYLLSEMIKTVKLNFNENQETISLWLLNLWQFMLWRDSYFGLKSGTFLAVLAVNSLQVWSLLLGFRLSYIAKQVILSTNLID